MTSRTGTSRRRRVGYSADDTPPNTGDNTTEVPPAMSADTLTDPETVTDDNAVNVDP